ncbi:MAG: 2-dehydropantoate 2-reductase [Gemmatimonadetes bacterium]|nr:2-dehydropantoate 2-reductase [Gemmatimonadota bacterium]
MRFAVVGVGAVGGLIGARLLQAGHTVSFLARGATAAHLRTRGLVVESVDGDVTLPAITVAEAAADIGPVDCVLVAVKATQVGALAPRLTPLVGPDTLVLPLQNGVEASTQLADHLGAEHVIEGVCRVIAALDGPGHIRHTAVRPVIEFGPRLGTPTSATLLDRLDALEAVFAGAGLVPQRPRDMGIASWEKFLFIEPIGVVCAASRQSFGVVRTVPALRQLADDAVREVISVGQAVGVAWPVDARERIWERYDSLPADSATSMARDLMAGRPSEFDAQTGAVVRLAERHGVAVPVHRVLHAILAAGTTPAT